MNPPEKAHVLSVDEKTQSQSQTQALDRTRPLLPMKSHQVERYTHDYLRHGTSTLFAALDLATGTVTDGCHEKHRAEEFFGFLKLIAKTYPHHPLHVIVDNASTHKTPEVQAWLAQQRRTQPHFTPTGSSWLNQVETWFSTLSRRAIRRGAFTSIGVLLQALQRLLDSWNGDCKPFVWVAAAEEIQQRCTVTVPVRRCTSNLVGTSARQLPKAAGDPA
jgi:transposase